MRNHLRIPASPPGVFSLLLSLGLSLAFPACEPAQRGPAPMVSGQGTQEAPSGMVVSSNVIASEVGAEILRAGGNAVDAAVATGFALAVVHPSAGNIGGGGFMVIRFPDGRTTTLDFREKAPLAAYPEMFLDENGDYSRERHHNSHLAVGVPGTVAGFALAHEKYGTGEWSPLVTPAVGLATEGIVLTDALAGSIENAVRSMASYPASLEKFTRNGEPYVAGDLWVQPDLARTLGRIRDEGRDGFYRGETARLIAEEMERGGGMITEEDLALYEARERTPIHGTFRGFDVISMPPPSSGGTALVEMLNILEAYDLAGMGHGSPAHIHYMAEAMRRAFRDRARYLADPDFAEMPLDELTSKAYAERLRSGIQPDRASVSEPSDLTVPAESLETTHFSVVDADGMAVAVTYTLEAGFGSKIVVPGAGFLLNNEMGDFNAGPGLTDDRGLIGTEPNLARPQQRMLSSMTPTILARDGALVAVTGSPGGRTIINTVLQVVLNVTEFGMGIQDAVDAKRIHHQWLPDRLQMEEGGMTPEVEAALERMGYTVLIRGTQGSAQSIMIDPATGLRIGAPDSRGEDSGAAGY
jgi:gamma-glutamyltranspeptidase/glutathione hydrolase